MTADEHEPPLSDSERKTLREMMERDRRASWVWSILRVWSTWIVAIVAALTVGWDFLKRIAKAAVE